MRALAHVICSMNPGGHPTRNHALPRRLAACLLLCLVSPQPARAQAAAPPGINEAVYRVEVLVFRHADSLAEPIEVSELRGMHELFEPGPGVMPEAPVARPEMGDSFRNLWSRLQRLAAYQPLAMSAWEQSQVDYHPPVRVHDGEIIAEELHFPGQVFTLDLREPDVFQAFLAPMYRLDGSVQLRRSRFLHLDLDLEYRVDNPDWPETPGVDPAPPTPGTAAGDEPPEEQPFRVHTLRQSRQVRTDTLHYFDTAFLGVLARVTAIDTDES